MMMYDVSFKDFIEKYTSVKGDEWVVLYDQNIERNLENDVFTFCAMIPQEKIRENNYMEKCEWGFSTDSFGKAGFGTYGFGDNEEIFYFDGQTSENFEYLVALRYFEKYSTSIEINPKFVWYGNLVKQNQGYVDPISDELIIKVDDSHIEVQRKYLKDFLCAEKKICIIVFDHRRFYNSDSDVKEKFREYKGENYIFEYCNMEARGVSREYNACSSIMGKVLITPFKKPHHSDYKYYTDEEKYETFIIDYDEEEEEKIEFICDEKKLGNYFGANPEAPHFLTPVFFDIKVLEKYKNDPRNYTIGDSSITFLNIWSIPFNINNERKVSVWLGDLGRIPYEEQQYWKLFNILPSGKMETNFVKRQLYSIWTDASRIESRLLSTINRFNALVSDIYDDIIFKFLSDSDKEIYNTFMLPINYSLPEYQSFLLQLSKLTVESINVRLIKKVMGEDYTSEVSGKGSVLQLGIFLKYTKLDEAERISSAIRKAYNSRNKLSGHSASVKEYNKIWGRDENYKFNSVEDARKLVEEIVTAIEYVIGNHEAKNNVSQ